MKICGVVEGKKECGAEAPLEVKSISPG